MDVFAAVEQIAIGEGCAVSVICEALSVSRSGFYAWHSREVSAREQRDAELTPVVREIFGSPPFLWRGRVRPQDVVVSV